MNHGELALETRRSGGSIKKPQEFDKHEGIYEFHLKKLYVSQPSSRATMEVVKQQQLQIEDTTVYEEPPTLETDTRQQKRHKFLNHVPEKHDRYQKALRKHFI